MKKFSANRVWNADRLSARLKLILMMVLGIISCGVAYAQEPERAPRVPDSEPPYVQDTTLTDADTTIEAQTFRLMARSYGDRIVIRWAPIDAGVWMTSNHYGWHLFRGSTDDNDTIFYTDADGDTVYEHWLTKDHPIMPMTLDEMKQRFDSTDFYAGVAAQAMYGVMHYDVNKADQTNENDLFSVAAKQYQEQTQRQFMAYLAAEIEPDVAQALGLRYVDTNVTPGILYQYTLESLIPKEIVDISPRSILVPCRPFVRKEDEMMPDIRFSQLDIHKVAIRWDKNKLSGYWLERSEDNGKNWTKINEHAPIWPMLPDTGTVAAYGDSVAQWMQDDVIFFDSLDLTKTYIYRVQAFDAFGEKLEWKKSPKFKLMDLQPPAQPLMLGVEPQENRRCVINWDVAYEDKDLKGFLVTFSRDLEGPWANVSSLLPKTARTYTDTLVYKRGRGLYRIFAVDTAGNVSFSPAMINSIEDIFPPEAPKNIRAISDDSTGLVLLSWDKNTDKDLLAYKVYFANQIDHTFIERTEGYIYKNEYFDSLDLTSLTNEIFYYVIAVDQNHNYSVPSDTIRVRFADLIPPGDPLLQGISQNGDTVIVKWLRSVSTDVEKYFVYRKFREAARWECLATKLPSDFDTNGILTFIDMPTPDPKAYAYCIEAVDSAGNVSGMEGQAVIMVEESPVFSVDIKLKASVNKDPKGVKLEWNYTLDTKKDYYGVVWRATEDGQFKDIGTFRRGDTHYIDETAPAGKLTYYIQLQLGRGRHSTPSQQTTIKMK